MIMKRLLYILMAFSMLIVGCSDKLGEENEYGKDCIVLNIYNSPMTKALDTQGANYERQLLRLDCFFYKKGQTDGPCAYYQKVDINKIGNVEVPFYVDESFITSLFGSEGTCEVFVIANLTSDLVGTGTFAAGQKGTDVESLGKLFTLETENANYDAVDKPFVMACLAECIKDSGNNAQATISLVRAAAKVTFSLLIPEEITVSIVTVDGEERTETQRVMTPILEEGTMKGALHNGAKKGYIYGTYPVQATDLYTTEKRNFKFVKNIPAVPATESSPATPAKKLYTFEAPLYTYARAWEKGDQNAAYWTFEMVWAYDSNGDGVANEWDTYYYQILINGAARSFKPNHWYDMTVNVGVLGSTVEALPKTLQELSYYVVNWTTETQNNGSGDRLENVEIQKYNYLEVPQTYIEMDNVSEVAIRYNASHKIGVKFNKSTGKSVPELPTTTNLHAFSISNLTKNGNTQDGTPRAVEITNITLKNENTPDINEQKVESNFTDNNKGLLTFNYKLDDGIYSPAYVFITIWLDVNGDGVHDPDEILTQDITIVIYPAIYIVGDNSYDHSIFINGYYNKNRSSGNSLGYLSIAGKQVGKAAGDDANTYMHVISISAFNENNYKFAYNNNKNKDTEYIIGDPRERSSNKLGIPDDKNNTANFNTANPANATNTPGWIMATDVNGTVRNLEYYYPTSKESYQVIAPKFRIASKLGGYSKSDPEGAVLRCASYQEHGFPAGRWRLPTTAEVLYIIELQRLGKIQQLFFGSTTYFTATDRVATDDNNNYTLTTGIGTAQASVRCVYDDWFWGSEREAIKNSDYNNYGGYQFTWGDRFIY